MQRGSKMFGSERLGLIFLAIVIAVIAAIAMARSCSRVQPQAINAETAMADSLQSIKIVKDTVVTKKSKAKNKKTNKKRNVAPFEREHLSESAE